jgi:hypothetical protein
MTDDELREFVAKQRQRATANVTALENKPLRRAAAPKKATAKSKAQAMMDELLA